MTVNSFFLSRVGRTLTLGAVQQMMRDVGQAAVVPRLDPHLLRHTAATQYLVNGGDAISLQHRLGHSGLEMTNRYIHFASAELAAIQERVAPMDKLEIKPMRVPRRKWTVRPGRDAVVYAQPALHTGIHAPKGARTRAMLLASGVAIKHGELALDWKRKP